jgi:L-aspartate oxidase
MVSETARTGAPVFLSMQHLDADWVTARFPTIAAACRSAGLDLARDPIPVGPAAHYMMGGVETDICGRTTLPGLCAAGEVACTGVHGANRLASNSLLEGLVFGARAVEAMIDTPRAGEMNDVRRLQGSMDRRSGASSDPPSSDPSVSLAVESKLRSLMWNAVGLLRDASTLEPAVEGLRVWHESLEPAAVQRPEDEALGRASNIATVGWLIATAALRRQESRGGHYRTDFPARDDLNWRIHVAEKR